MILVAAWLAARLSAAGARRFLKTRVSSSLLRNVFARVVGGAVLVFGLYIVLRVSGLTRLALTVVGGTGILGLVIGIAFRNITENFLASVVLSMRRPFLVGDLVEIVGIQGYVQALTTRATVLMTLTGNYVEIPNATVYKNTIRNFTTNKNRREDFTVGVAYDASLTKAQQVALRVLGEHPAVLKDPEPWALVDSLGAAAVVLRVYFWIDGSQHSFLKVRSALIRLVKSAFQEAGINIPDEAREVIFPRGVPVKVTRDGRRGPADAPPESIDEPDVGAAEAEPAATNAEGGLGSEAQEIEDQARQARKMEGDNLLHPRAGAAQS
jgi:small-conductance mechanosensitive channel